MRTIVALIPFVAALGCGSSDDKSRAGDKACQDFSAKLAECHLTAASPCNTNDPCVAECQAHADCAQLQASAPSGSYLQCMIVCSGGSPDDFVCKDGAHFVKASQRCDGHVLCPDGSDEADCGNGAGGASSSAGGTSAASGGATMSGGGAAGLPGGAGGISGGGGGAGGASASASPECEAMVAHEIAACPQLDQASELRQCADGASLYGPEGCGAAWKAYVDCTAKAPFDCNNGPSGCDTQQSGYFTCQSQFVARTGCTRLEGQDGQCAGATPYSFGCLSSIPSGCVNAPSGGSSATFACCPAFPAP